MEMCRPFIWGLCFGTAGQGVDLSLRALWVPHHQHIASDQERSTILRQFLRSPSTSHLAVILLFISFRLPSDTICSAATTAHGCCAMSPMADISLFRPEPLCSAKWTVWPPADHLVVVRRGQV